MNNKFQKIIEVTNLKKNFSGFQALKGINLQVTKGEIIGLLGPNGAGKTTTIKILTGLLAADQGNIKLMGKDIKNKIPTWIKEKIGVVFEESNLYLRLNAFDNLKLFAGINDVNNNKIYQLLSEYQLQQDAKKEVKNFSKGMKKRLMICRALIAEPEILILDEATGGLDPISAEIIRNKVLKLKEEGKTVVLSTHYLEEADRLCDRVAFINQGQVIAVDSPTVFKDELESKFLEIKFEIKDKTKDKINSNQVLSFVESIIDFEDKYFFETEILIVQLKINQKIFKKSYILAKKFKLIEVNKIEANLQQVFNKFNA